jgi:hypothetical protein
VTKKRRNKKTNYLDCRSSKTSLAAWRGTALWRVNRCLPLRFAADIALPADTNSVGIREADQPTTGVRRRRVCVARDAPDLAAAIWRWR